MKSMPDACDETGCQLVEYSPFGDSCQLETFFFAYFFFEKSKWGLGQRPSKFFLIAYRKIDIIKTSPDRGLFNVFFVKAFILFLIQVSLLYAVELNQGLFLALHLAALSLL